MIHWAATALKGDSSSPSREGCKEPSPHTGSPFAHSQCHRCTRRCSGATRAVPAPRCTELPEHPSALITQAAGRTNVCASPAGTTATGGSLSGHRGGRPGRAREPAHMSSTMAPHPLGSSIGRLPPPGRQNCCQPTRHHRGPLTNVPHRPTALAEIKPLRNPAAPNPPTAQKY